ncbi:2-succinyl-6-hydroxy-2,4-cyclohexadiene-1-carboxylate synthase [Candidatus Binatia bacterium]|nr:2-succinyl-6-hydroxy-2,4-cyclohexadiene-1-carboxylate synthase [Candidatus Binatia bacterium]
MPRVIVGDVALHADVHGTGPPLLLLHGFTGSVASWRPLLPVLARRYTTIGVDLVGHGRSDAPSDPARYAFRACIDDLARLLDRLDVERCGCLGYSMGGRIALGLALTHPSRVATLTLESASPGLVDDTERAARRAADTMLAARIEGDGVAAFVDAWIAQPLFASQARLDPATRARQREERLRHSAHGLAHSLRGMGTGAQPSLWAALPALTPPVLLVAGAEDDKFRRIATEMQAHMPQAELAVIPEAGHTTHLEQPAAFLEAVMTFLNANLGPSLSERGRGEG